MIYSLIYDVVALQLENHESSNRGDQSLQSTAAAKLRTKRLIHGPFFLGSRSLIASSPLPQPHPRLIMTSPRYPRLGLVFVEPVEVEGLEQLRMTNCPINGEHNIRLGRWLKSFPTWKN